MSTGNGNDTDVKAMQAELRELRARVRTLEAEKRRPTLEGHGARVQAIAAEAARSDAQLQAFTLPGHRTYRRTYRPV